MALRVGVIGAARTATVQRLGELAERDGESLVTGTDPGAAAHLVIAVDAPDDPAYRAAADVWLDGPASVDELWRHRIAPFAANLRTGKRGPRRRRAILTGPDPSWPVQARRLIARLRRALPVAEVLRIDHVGSTSVPGLPAKDLLDLQVVVPDLAAAGRVADRCPEAGFVRVHGTLYGIDRFGNRQYEEVAADADPGRPVNVHINPADAPLWRELLLFRDFLRAHPDERDAYLALKQELAARPDTDVDDYSDAKLPWIAAACGRAEQWAAATGWTP